MWQFYLVIDATCCICMLCILWSCSLLVSPVIEHMYSATFKTSLLNYCKLWFTMYMGSDIQKFHSILGFGMHWCWSLFYVCLVMLCHPYQMGYEVCYIISSKSQRELYRVLFKQKKRSLDPKNKGQIFQKIQKFILAYIISQTKPTKALNIAQVTCLCLKELI